MLQSLAAPTRDRFLDSLSAPELDFLLHDWQFWSRPDQWPPSICESAALWRTWLILGGRGAGKTRSGAEWVRMNATTMKEQNGFRRFALIAETIADARDVMVEGISGLLAIHRDDERPRYEPSKRRVSWPNGAMAWLFSAEDPDALRGHQFDAAWCDELCKWRYGEESWDMLQFGLRLGQRPQCLITTTPRPMPLLKRIMGEATTVVTRASTQANRANLAPGFIETILALYEGTRLGRQEIDGDILDDHPDALWNHRQFDDIRRDRVPVALRRVVIAVDPPVSSGPKADSCGIVVAGRDADGCAYILADLTVQGYTPLGWARHVAAVWRRHEADCLIVEANQGGDLVRTLIHQIDATIAVKAVYARHGKATRAEPVAALYERGRVFHVGRLGDLEDQMCSFSLTNPSRFGSPDRVDALVWAVTDLLLRDIDTAPRIRAL